MAKISILKIDDKVFERLQIRATFHGQSIEEEICQILKDAVNVPERIGDLAIEYFGENNGVRLVIPTRT